MIIARLSCDKMDPVGPGDLGFNDPTPIETWDAICSHLVLRLWSGNLYIGQYHKLDTEIDNTPGR